jgi:hypothetical protein
MLGQSSSTMLATNAVRGSSLRNVRDERRAPTVMPIISSERRDGSRLFLLQLLRGGLAFEAFSLRHHFGDLGKAVHRVCFGIGIGCGQPSFAECLVLVIGAPVGFFSRHRAGAGKDPALVEFQKFVSRK